MAETLLIWIVGVVAIVILTGVFGAVILRLQVKKEMARKHSAEKYIRHTVAGEIRTAAEGAEQYPQAYCAMISTAYHVRNDMMAELHEDISLLVRDKPATKKEVDKDA